jgi:hypothetical protein
MQTLIKVIIEHQYNIIGPLALEQANKVPGLKVSYTDSIKIQLDSNNPKEALSQLVTKYQELFGNASVEVCKDAIKEAQSSVPKSDLPDILK